MTGMVCGERTGRMGQLVRWTKKARQSRKQTVPSPLITPILIPPAMSLPLKVLQPPKTIPPLGKQIFIHFKS